MKKAFHTKSVAVRRKKSRNLTTQELEKPLLESWKSINYDQLLRLVWSMPVVAVFKAGGGVAKYKRRGKGILIPFSNPNGN